MAERRVDCAVKCPHEEKINAVYRKVISGNGDLPLPERVRKMEGEMEEVLPSLRKLVSASERAEGERTSDIAFHNKRDKELKEAVNQHNWRIMFAVAIVGLILAALQLYIDNRNHRPDGTLLIPHHITSPKTSGQTYTAQTNQPQYAGKEW